MKTKYKYIHFVERAVALPRIEAQMFASPHQVWLCKNKTTTLAQVYYYEHWHQYVAAFNKDAVFSADCLKDMQDFLNQINTKEDENGTDR